MSQPPDGDVEPTVVADEPAPDADDEVARLAAERDALREQLEDKEGKRRRRGRLRRVGVAVLVVLASITVPLAITSLWARRTVVNTEQWTDTMGPLAQEPAVQTALADNITTQINGAIDVENLLREALPDRGQILAAPLANAIEGFVHDKVDEVVRSEQFANLWTQAVERAQQGTLAVLRGESSVLRSEDGKVVLNLVPVINNVFGRINETSPQVLGRNITLPEISSAELPDAARQKLEQALGRPLPEDFGRIVVFDDDRLAAAQDAFQLVQRAILALVIVALACLAAAIALSRARRRTILQLAFGIALGLVLVRRLSLRLQADVLDMFKVATNRDAVEVVTNRVLGGLMDWTRWALIVCVVVAVIALLTGPYRWAVALRRGVVSLGMATIGAAKGAPDRVTLDWFMAHRQPLQIGVAVAGALILLVFDLSWLLFLIVVGVVAAVEVWLARLQEPALGADEPPPTAPPGPPVIEPEQA